MYGIVTPLDPIDHLRVQAKTARKNAENYRLKAADSLREATDYASAAAALERSAIGFDQAAQELNSKIERAMTGSGSGCNSRGRVGVDAESRSPEDRVHA